MSRHVWEWTSQPPSRNPPDAWSQLDRPRPGDYQWSSIVSGLAKPEAGKRAEVVIPADEITRLSLRAPA
jgi:hypothetical protein